MDIKPQILKKSVEIVKFRIYFVQKIVLPYDLIL
jgi:hypothetical protein